MKICAKQRKAAQLRKDQQRRVVSTAQIQKPVDNQREPKPEGGRK